MNSVLINNINIEVIRKKVKHIRLSVHPPNGKVRIVVNERMNDDDISVFIISKLSWIEKQREKFLLQDIQIPKRYLSGEIHKLFGTEYVLKLLKTSGKQYIEIKNNNEINLYIRSNSTIEKREKIMIEWYRKEIKSIIPEYIEKWEPIIGVEIQDWGVKLMKTRWGTCNIQAKRIWINLELAKKNLRCLDYIVVHEMVHILERKHNERFQSYMDEFLPNWRSIQAELNGLIYEDSK